MNAPTAAKYLTPDTMVELSDALDDRIDALMAPGAEFDPLDVRNLEEAVGDALAALPCTLAPMLAAALREGKCVNALLLETSRAYWAPAAQLQAEENRADARRDALVDRADTHSSFAFAS